MQIIVDLLGGAMGAAIVAGLFSLIHSKRTKKEAQDDKKDVQNKALRYIMLYIIQERAKSHIKDGSISLEERRSLHHWHSLYHDGLGGNGDAKALMAQVDKLPLDTDY